MSDNTSIINETLKAIEEGFYLKDFVIHNIKLSDIDIRHSRIYLPKDVKGLKKFRGTHYMGGSRLCTTCENADSFTVARKLSKDYDGKILVLNLANPVHPGGGVRNGARAQEEDLCRKSTLLVSLEDKSAEKYYTYNRKLNTYMGSDAVIITPRVEILRDENNQWLDDSVVVSVMTCAAPMIKHGLEGMSQQEYEDMLYRRIQGMLKVAATGCYKRLVLGAFGCGAFGNDAHIVSALFYKALKETDFGGYKAEELFNSVTFAVLDNTKEQYNFNEFNRYFGEGKFYAAENKEIEESYARETKEKEVFLDSIRGCMIGGAVGDALGYGVNDLDYSSIKNKFGERGITSYLLSEGKALISDNTQLSLFTANGVNYARTRGHLRGIGGIPSNYMHNFYLDWLITQKKNKPSRRGHESYIDCDYSWLLDVEELYSSRVTDVATINSLEELKINKIKGKELNFTDNRNNYKGCGALARIVPLALVDEYGPIEAVDKEASEIARITHCHPVACITSALLVHILNRIVFTKENDTLLDIVLDAQKTVNKIFKDERYLTDVNELIDRAVLLAERCFRDSDEENIRKIGSGFPAEEALAISIYCALRYDNEFSEGIIAAVNHSGNSAAIGAITGNILGALLGYEAIEDKWTKDLELKDVIIEMADDTCHGCRMSEFGRYYDNEWMAKYADGIWPRKKKNAETIAYDKQLIGFYHEFDDYGCFSNWYPASFEYAGKKYSSVEQYMMYQKVTMFGQYELAEKIMSTDNPVTIKKLGATRFNVFNPKVWDSLAYTIVKRGVKAKFAQNFNLFNELMSTGDAILMECSENDTIWGIGLDIDDKRIYNPELWRGNNQLGRILMSVRDEFREELTLFDGGTVKVDINECILEWKLKVSVLMSNPKYHNAIKAYVNTLNGIQRDAAIKCTFEQIDNMMQTNMGGGLPIVGFYEMKQEVYEIAKRCSMYRKWRDS